MEGCCIQENNKTHFNDGYIWELRALSSVSSIKQEENNCCQLSFYKLRNRDPARFRFWKDYQVMGSTLGSLSPIRPGLPVPTRLLQYGQPTRGLSVLIIYHYCYLECLSLKQRKAQHREAAPFFMLSLFSCSVFLLYMYFSFSSFSFVLFVFSSLPHILPFPLLFTFCLFHSLSPKIILHDPLYWERVEIVIEIPFWWQPGPTQVVISLVQHELLGACISTRGHKGVYAQYLWFYQLLVPGWLPSW